ncbi:hypothetical protein PF011_g27872 [Phytophthora fragariae]|uniref:Uncharacterized protein n=1 Tax=Phytophthora fragariae TaxID=53985 RepID=A0A6A3HBG3_9STRA|nr:hypothetical protein PF003_g26760 [Phytophthora fragariae]KAE8966610.1 hypothetical protein PF011_g27872 [Phytophthora fragariae]
MQTRGPSPRCGLSFFSSIQSLQSQTRPRTTEDLIEESVMLEIMKCGGSNTYKIPHLTKDKLRNAGKLPTTLPCDVQA